MDEVRLSLDRSVERLIEFPSLCTPFYFTNKTRWTIIEDYNKPDEIFDQNNGAEKIDKEVK